MNEKECKEQVYLELNKIEKLARDYLNRGLPSDDCQIAATTQYACNLGVKVNSIVGRIQTLSKSVESLIETLTGEQNQWKN